MVAVYAVAVLAGAAALIGWLVWDTQAAAPNARRPGPTQRFGERGRTAVTALLGVGLGGMSASFAGWGTPLAAGAAVAGAVLLTIASRALVVVDDDA